MPGRATIRGERRGVAMGPRYRSWKGRMEAACFITAGDHVRITGLRLRERAQQKHARVEGDK